MSDQVLPETPLARSAGVVVEYEGRLHFVPATVAQRIVSKPVVSPTVKPRSVLPCSTVTPLPAALVMVGSVPAANVVNPSPPVQRKSEVTTR